MASTPVPGMSQIVIHYTKNGRSKTTTVPLPTEQQRKLDLISYCRGHCQVLGGRYVKHEVTE
jgi:hypothetical protein